ncbi:MAG: phospholipase D family protein [Mangrovicoccus sp.]
MAFDVEPALAPIEQFQFLLTAEEAYPAFEEAVFKARREISASFRVFDPQTRLRSEIAQSIGATWADLLAHVLRRGVNITLVISDFDALAKPQLHQATTKSLRQLEKIRDGLPQDAGKLTIRAALHPAKLGFVPRLLLWPVMQKKLAQHAAWLNSLPKAERQDALEHLPGLAPYLRERDGKLRPDRLSLPPLFPATHHQKIAVIDQETLFLGGLDLDERRYDTPDHDRPAEQTWHDLQLLARGTVAKDALQHLGRFEDEVSGRLSATPRRHILTTLSRRTWGPFALWPRSTRRDLANAFIDGAMRAEKLIYIETQFFRDTKLARKLARIGKAKPRLSIILLLPAAPEGVAFEHRQSLDLRHGEALQLRCLSILRRGFGDRLTLVTPAQPRHGSGDPRDKAHGAPIIYVHAKTACFDDHTALISSANLNGRSGAWDTEAGLRLSDPDHIRELRQKLFDHWLPENAGDEFYAPSKAAQNWQKLARENAATEPTKRQGFLLPLPLKRPRRFAALAPFFPDEMV